ncbi:MAG: VOC family protein [Cyanobacteria bacterium J06638_22]
MTASTLQATALDHVTLYVKDLRESVAFYKALFGFSLKKDQPEYNSQIIGNDAIKLCLYEDPGKALSGGLAHFGLHIQNFSEIIEECEALGVPMPYGIVEWEEKTRSVYIIDPSGYEIELSEVNGSGL